MTALKHLAILPRSAAKWLGRRLSAKQLLTKNEARRIAVNVAKAAGVGAEGVANGGGSNSKAAEGVNRDGFAFVPYTLPL
jgi:hypothetical protein